MALVLFDCANPLIGKITLNDAASLNAMSETMAQEFKALIESLPSKHPQLRVLILTGSGRAFSAGGQLEMLEQKRSKSREENYRGMLAFYTSFLGMLELGIPLIAAVHGPAIGAGLCLAAACDIRIAAENSKLGFTFTRLGLYPGMGATYFLPRIVGNAYARELLLSARVVTAQEASQLGLVSQVVPENQVFEQAESLAKEIAACGPTATRHLLRTLRGDPYELKAFLEKEAEAQSMSYASQEFAEGLNAVREKRPACFK